MKTLIVTSNYFTGQIIFEYDSTGRLEALRVQADLKEESLKWIGANVPWFEKDIPSLTSATKKLIFSLTDREITFDMFWHLYNDKSRSSKKKTEAQWDRLSKADQVKAYCFVPVYLKNKGQLGKKYATTYLNDELWNN